MKQPRLLASYAAQRLTVKALRTLFCVWCNLYESSDQHNVTEPAEPAEPAEHFWGRLKGQQDRHVSCELENIQGVLLPGLNKQIQDETPSLPCCLTGGGILPLAVVWLVVKYVVLPWNSRFITFSVAALIRKQWNGHFLTAVHHFEIDCEPESFN